jgi:hypothetical protein
MMALWSGKKFEGKGSEKKCFKEKKKGQFISTFFLHMAGNLQPDNTASQAQRQ